MSHWQEVNGDERLNGIYLEKDAKLSFPDRRHLGWANDDADADGHFTPRLYKYE